MLMEDFTLQNKAISIIANRNSGKSVRTERTFIEVCNITKSI